MEKQNPLPPLDLPDVVAHCHQCSRPTPTKILFLQHHLGNACAACGCLRKRKPYLSQSELETLKPIVAKGGKHASRIR